MMERAIICDVDGTVAIRGDRDIYDYTKINLDTPNKPIVDLLTVIGENRDVLFVSGREDSCLRATQEWLERAMGYCFLDSVQLFMRKTGDHRKDAIIKREIYDEHIRGAYQVDYVLDDRNQVVEMWRSLGLTVLQVANGDF